MQRLRKVLRVCAVVAVAVVAVIVAAYLARRPLFERLLLREMEAAARSLLGGEVRIETMGGSWITDLELGGIELRDATHVRRLEGGALSIRFSLLRLLGGDLSGVREVRLRADRVELDPSVPSGPTGGGGQEAGTPDLGRLAALLPDGAVVRVRELAVAGQGSALRGPFALDVSPRSEVSRDGPPLHLELEAPGVAGRVDLDGSGRVVASITAPRAADWLRLFARVPGLERGAIRAKCTLRLRPQLSVDADVEIENTAVRGRSVREIVVRGSLRGDRLAVSALRADASGLRLEAGDLAAELGSGSFPRPLAGSLRLMIEDLRPWEGLVPEQVRAQLPVLPIAGTLAAELDQAGRAGRVEVALAVRDRTGATGRITGTLGVRLAPGRQAFVLEPELVVTGSLLRAAERLTLRGSATVDAVTARFEPLRLALEPGGDVEVGGKLALAATDLAAFAGGTGLDLTARAFDIAPIAALAGLPPALSGKVDTRIVLDGTSRWSVVATASLSGVPALDQARIELDASLDETGATVRRAALASPAAALEARARMPGLRFDALLREPSAALGAAIDGEASLSVPDLSRLELDRWTSLQLAGRLAADLALAGTLREPRPQLDVRSEGVAWRGDSAPEVRDVRGTLHLTPRELEIHELALVVAGHPLVLDGKMRRGEAGYEIESLAVRGAGQARLRGTLGPRLLADPVGTLRQDARLTLVLERVALAPLAPLAGMAGVGGELTGKLELANAGAPVLRASLEGSLTGVVAERKDEVLAFDLRAVADPHRVAIERLTASGFGGRIEGTLALPQTSLARLLDEPGAIRQHRVDGALRFERFDLASLPAKPLGLADLAGRVSGVLALAGPLAEAVPTLQLELEDAGLRIAGGPRLENIAAKLMVRKNEVACESLTATIGAGPLSAAGTFRVPGNLRADWRRGELDLRVEGRDVLLHRRNGLKLRSDLDLRASGRLKRLRVTGKAELHTSKFVARVPYLTLGRAGGAAVREGIVLEGPDLGEEVAIELDVEVATKEPIQVETNVARGGIVVALQLTGTLREPRLVGTALMPNGSLILPGCRFRTTNSILRFERDDPFFPQLNLRGVGRRHGYEVQILVRGRYDRPEIVLSSTPPLPARDLAVLVTTGSRPQSTGGARSVGLVVGSYLAEELADYIFGSESTEAKESFIERFRFETGTEISAAGTESAVVEFRLLDNVYLQGERDVYEDINFGVLYRIRFK